MGPVGLCHRCHEVSEKMTMIALICLCWQISASEFRVERYWGVWLKMNSRPVCLVFMLESGKSPAGTVLHVLINGAASGQFFATIFGPSHSIFWPARKDTQPSSMISVRRAAISKRE